MPQHSGLLYGLQRERTPETIANCTPKVQDVFTRPRAKERQKTSEQDLPEVDFDVCRQIGLKGKNLPWSTARTTPVGKFLFSQSLKTVKAS